MASAGPQKDLRAVTMLWPNVEHFILKRDLVRTGTIDDLPGGTGGQRVSMGLENSGTLGSNRVLMENLGLDADAAYELAFMGYAPSSDALVNGDIVGMSTPAGLPVGAATKALGNRRRPTAGIHRGAVASRRMAASVCGRPTSSPQVPIRGRIEDVQTMAQPNFLAVRADVDEDAVYLMTKTIFENLPFLQNIHPATNAMALESALSGLPMPLHPGRGALFPRGRPRGARQTRFDGALGRGSVQGELWQRRGGARTDQPRHRLDHRWRHRQHVDAHRERLGGRARPWRRHARFWQCAAEARRRRSPISCISAGWTSASCKPMS